MIRIIDSRDTGKTKELLRECSIDGGLFICKHPEKVFEKCKAYDIDSTKIIPCGYNNYKKYLDLTKNVYIDELELFANYSLNDCNLLGYSLTMEGK